MVDQILIVEAQFPILLLSTKSLQVFAMIETREAIQNLDSILDLEVRKSTPKPHVQFELCLKSFAGGENLWKC